MRWMKLKSTIPGVVLVEGHPFEATLGKLLQTSRKWLRYKPSSEIKINHIIKKVKNYENEVTLSIYKLVHYCNSNLSLFIQSGRQTVKVAL